MRNHGLPSVSVSDVEVTRDMEHAKIFVTALQPERSKEAMKALKALAPEIRYQLAQSVKMRHVPELHFHYDDSVDRGERIDNLLRDLPDPTRRPENRATKPHSRRTRLLRSPLRRDDVAWRVETRPTMPR